jgi:quercetin dioxygenase-like cupin family protein
MNLFSDGTKLALDNDIPWAPMGPDPDGGVDMKLFRVDEKNNKIVFLNRFQPGFVAIKHRHLGEVHAYTLQGRWHYFEYDWVSGPGDYVYEEPDTIHTLEALPDNTEPTIVFFVVEGGLDVYDDEDNIMLTVDIPMFEEMYRQGIEALGLSYPENILR